MLLRFGCRRCVPALCVTTAILSAPLGLSAQTGKRVVTIADLEGRGETAAFRDSLWAQFAKRVASARPDVELKVVAQKTDAYETTGLTAQLVSDSPPDIYTEWSGARVRLLQKHGLALDLTDALSGDGWRERFLPIAWTDTLVRGRNHLIPRWINLSVLVWYNRRVFAAHHLSEPKGFEDWLAQCAVLKRAGVTPIAICNRNLWPAGNFACLLACRVAGERAVTGALRLEGAFLQPGIAEGFRRLALLRARGYVNQDLNSVSNQELIEACARGRVAMVIDGSWSASRVLEMKLTDRLGYFKLPPIAGGRGDQTSLLGDVVGFAVHPRGSQKEAAIQVLRMLSDPDGSALFSGWGRVTGLKDQQYSPFNRRMRELIDATGTLLPPPDVGYELAVADAFNMAATEVLSGLAPPEAALRSLDDRLLPLRQAALGRKR